MLHLEIPEQIRQFLKKREKYNFSSENCKKCNAGCCSGPGFAILENVLLIYNKYISGLIVREDYKLEQKLDFKNFILKYFDRVLLHNRLLVFFPKILNNNELIAIPPWNYFGAREYITKRVKSNGCIFLNKKLHKGSNTGHYCILHDDNLNNIVSTKPIDCTFLICSKDKKVINPSEDETLLWFSMLNYYFPESKKRFDIICPNMPD
jgi:hypothetical protein